MENRADRQTKEEELIILQQRDMVMSQLTKTIGNPSFPPKLTSSTSLGALCGTNQMLFYSQQVSGKKKLLMHATFQCDHYRQMESIFYDFSDRKLCILC